MSLSKAFNHNYSSPPRWINGYRQCWEVNRLVVEESEPHTTQNESGPIRFEREMGTPTWVHRLKVYLFTMPLVKFVKNKKRHTNFYLYKYSAWKHLMEHALCLKYNFHYNAKLKGDFFFNSFYHEAVVQLDLLLLSWVMTCHLPFRLISSTGPTSAAVQSNTTRHIIVSKVEAIFLSDIIITVLLNERKHWWILILISLWYQYFTVYMPIYFFCLK